MKIQFELDSAATGPHSPLLDRDNVPSMGDTLVFEDESYIVTRVVQMLDPESPVAVIISATSR